MRILKFGGSSIGTLEGFSNVLNIIGGYKSDTAIAVVVSALGGVTNNLLELINQTLQEKSVPKDQINLLFEEHETFIKSFVSAVNQKACLDYLDSEIAKISKYLNGMALLEECTPKSRDAILSFGEKCSQIILAAALKSRGHKIVSFTPGSLILTNSHFGAARVNYNETMVRIRHSLQNLNADTIAVVAGFLGTDNDGIITTLGRDGSDYTAGLLGAALNAEVVEIWSNVDGVLDGDPDLLENAKLIRQLHYREAAEIAFFGAQVLHPKTIRPLESSQISIIMKNTFNPDCPGTLINSEKNYTGYDVKIITSVPNVVLSKISVNKPRKSSIIFSRFFELLDHLEISALMVNQNSADASFSVAIPEKQADTLQKDIEDTFADELSQNPTIQAEMISGFSIVTAIGYEVAGKPEVMSGFFYALHSQNIKSINISQGVSRHNISVLVKDNDCENAVKVLHNALVCEQKSNYKLAVNQ